MAKDLLDTNIILRFSNPSDAQHRIAIEAVTTLLAQDAECYLSPQVLIELWVVATRPSDVNGLGWSTGHTRKVIHDLLERFPIVDDLTQIFDEWLKLVTAQDVKGKRTHDMRIVALMRTAKIDHILTLNPRDFSGVSDIIVVTPQDVIQPQADTE